MRDLAGDENAVSISIGFILTFSITVLVMVIALTSFYSLMGQAEQTVMRDEFDLKINFKLDATLHPFVFRQPNIAVKETLLRSPNNTAMP